jgi:hypothetical protein
MKEKKMKERKEHVSCLVFNQRVVFYNNIYLIVI